ncbi:MAG: gamma-glutamyl-gamma-aminobutyrate hydrolase family protein [Bacteroidales bacterium]
MKKCLLIDCYDSFSHKLAQSIEQTGLCSVDILAYNRVLPEALGYWDIFVMSPGPGLAYEYPALFRLISHLRQKPLLGVCLGHQVMALYCGGRLAHLPAVVHGQQKSLHIQQDNTLFDGVLNGEKLGLYHSWHVAEVPQQMRILAVSGDKCIMVLQHELYPWTSVQFHPESYMTRAGTRMLANWVTLALNRNGR